MSGRGNVSKTGFPVKQIRDEAISVLDRLWCLLSAFLKHVHLCLEHCKPRLEELLFIRKSLFLGLWSRQVI